MKHQALFSLKDKSKQRKKNVSSAAVLLGALRVNRKHTRTLCLPYLWPQYTSTTRKVTVRFDSLSRSKVMRSKTGISFSLTNSTNI